MIQKQISIIIVLLLFNLLQSSPCAQQKRRQALRGDYQNVLKPFQGALQSTRNTNIFAGGFDNSSMFRNAIYQITFVEGFTFCVIGQEISITLLQTFELNTLVLWIWDKSVSRTYDLKVYAKYNNTLTRIFDSTTAKEIIRIQFNDQLVDQFQIYNRGGNTENTGVFVIKAEAYYKLK